ncbi:MAG: M23 family metallopeptidase [Thermomicrobiales bacterium]|nr:M23 family metallopeptidase [Thermomicrobiales bacterium]
MTRTGLSSSGFTTMRRALSRRALFWAAIASGLAARPAVGTAAQSANAPAFSYPMGFPGQPLGDGLLMRHGYACENTWYFPGWWHTGENWYRADGEESAGIPVYAVAAGEVVYADFDYPGRVVIVQHGPGLFSQYGHLDYELAVAPGQPVARGDLLGSILLRTDGRARSHLHFEIRTFYTQTDVNGSAPRYGVSCGVECPPGPGYWPMDAPEHPSAMGWRNPTHVIARRAWGEPLPADAEVVVSSLAPATTPLWSAPADAAEATVLEELALAPSDTYALLAISAGDEASTATSAEGYHLWYQIAVQGGTAWVQAAVPLAYDTGSDGRPSSVRFDFLPLVLASEA